MEKIIRLFSYYTTDDQHRCSGYGVYPGGAKCKGCSDCKVAHNSMVTFFRLILVVIVFLFLLYLYYKLK